MPTKSVTPRRQPKQSKLSFKPASQTGNATTPNGKKGSANANGNILNFFKKVEVEEQLFLPGASNGIPAEPEPRTLLIDEDIYGVEDGIPKTEYEGGQHPSKRRKLSHDAGRSPCNIVETDNSDQVEQEANKTEKVPLETPQREPTKQKRGRGPFMADSDSEDDDTADQTPPKRSITITTIQPSTTMHKPDVPVPPPPNLPVDESCPDPLDEPDIHKKDAYDDQFKDIEDMEGLFGDDDEFDAEGEEFRERRFMEEQARLEAEERHHTREGDCSR
ncbi:hypothetical protein O1611_g6080 [Lasiodiplodia mahajangana]|uniref:Uncharacterized protein n=1 Tax=Lasiodiplodia mahajangana TaxID=1108764 RepID=A0ACC2JJY5_9PEZI|nr:hypothetical protein O1611_g6080 [Lasiodiplodia mahajangana]